MLSALSNDAFRDRCESINPPVLLSYIPNKRNSRQVVTCCDQINVLRVLMGVLPWPTGHRVIEEASLSATATMLKGVPQSSSEEELIERSSPKVL